MLLVKKNSGADFEKKESPTGESFQKWDGESEKRYILCQISKVSVKM
jgi:hypothetical protein